MGGRKTEAHAYPIIDALPGHIAVLNETGTIVAVNAAWSQFAAANGPKVELTGVGVNYIGVCEAAGGDEAEGAAAFASGIRAVVRAEQDEFTCEYACHSPEEQRWFCARVARIPGDEPTCVVVVHEDITALTRALMASSQDLIQTEREHQRLLAILEATPDLVSTADTNGRLLYMNRSGRQLIGKGADEDLKTALIPDAHPAWAQKLIAEEGLPVARRNGLWSGETAILRHDGREIPMSQVILSHTNTEGEVAYFSTIARDISTRKRTEQQLREAYQLLETIFDHTHMVLAYLDPEFNFVSVNRAYAEADQHRQDYFPGKNLFGLYPNADNERIFRHVRQTGKPFFAIAKPFVYPEHPERGQSYWDWSIVPIKNAAGGIAGFILMLLDVTQRVRAEEQLQHLSNKLLAAQEDERRMIARELHDEVGQVLLTLKIHLQHIEEQPEPPDVLPHVYKSLALIDQALQQTRDLSLTLHPSVLDDFGLEAALEWYIEQQAKHRGVAVQLDSNLDVQRFLPHVETACFRVVQEAMSNVLKHAQAETVQLSLHHSAAGLSISVEDDGGGFDVTAAQQQARHGESLGLLSMEERIHLAGGSIEIVSTVGQGTAIHIQFPPRLSAHDEPNQEYTLL